MIIINYIKQEENCIYNIILKQKIITRVHLVKIKVIKIIHNKVNKTISTGNKLIAYQILRHYKYILNKEKKEEEKEIKTT